jgi:hypothetical protein
MACEAIETAQIPFPRFINPYAVFATLYPYTLRLTESHPRFESSYFAIHIISAFLNFSIHFTLNIFYTKVFVLYFLLFKYCATRQEANENAPVANVAVFVFMTFCHPVLAY